MPAPENLFKKALKDGETLIGCWLSLADAGSAEIMGTTGFDWLVIDGEHAPNDIRSIRESLIALESSPSHAVVRVPIGEAWLIKQVLDAGAQTVLVPMVESADQARQLVKACRYPPHGDRGVGYSAARAARFGLIEDYGQTADDQISLLVQVENRAGLAALDDILQVDGIDGVFIGPADLAADMGHIGNLLTPEVQQVVMDALHRIDASGKAAGILATQDDMINHCIESGARFVAVGLDLIMLAKAARQTSAYWKRHVTTERQIKPES